MHRFRLPAAFLVVNAMFVIPGWIVAGEIGPRWIALEAGFLVGLFALLLPSRASRGLAVAAAAAVTFVCLLLLADATTRLSLGRSLNVYLDLHLVGSVRHLIAGMLGPAGAAFALGGLLLTAAVVPVAVVAVLSPLREPGGNRPVAGALVIAAAVGLALAGTASASVGQRVGLPAVGVVVEQVRQLHRMLGERERFASELAASPTRPADAAGFLHALEDTDVVLGFIESYGISAVRDPRYAPVLGPRLLEMEERLEAAGLHLLTGTLEAPVQGGQSWLARGSLLSGLRLDSQLRYDLLMASGRETLVHDFRELGHRTVAVMPAITMAWPEGERLGYEWVLAHDDMDYRGPPLNWVTMPDQYTWSFFERTARSGRTEGPLFAVLALISSHAPWTPILPVLDRWEDIEDGSLFGPWEGAGEPPEELWRDPERVREHFALSVDYAVNTAIGYAERYVDEHTLLIVLGDHQPAPLITGEGAGRAVPVHVISGDAELIRPFVDLGFVPGGIPSADAPSLAMDAFRRWFIGAYSEPPVDVGVH